MTVRSFLVTVLTGARGMLAERATLAATAVVQVVIVMTMGALWRTSAEAGGGSLAGYSAAALVWYVAIAEAAGTAVVQRLIELIGDDIADGSIASEMLRPASVLGVRLAAELGRSLPRLATAVVAGSVVALALGAAAPDAGGLVLAAPALVLAVIANLASQHAFGALAFWLRDIRSTWYVYQKLIFILGGMLIPLEVLPDGLSAVARALPFAAMAYVPARLASGHVEPLLLAFQAAWIVALLALATVAFAAGERRLQAVGG